MSVRCAGAPAPAPVDDQRALLRLVDAGPSQGRYLFAPQRKFDEDSCRNAGFWTVTSTNLCTEVFKLVQTESNAEGGCPFYALGSELKISYWNFDSYSWGKNTPISHYRSKISVINCGIGVFV
jgi:hypothetical protein